MSIHLKSIFKFRQIGKIGVIGFFSAIGFAFVSTIWSLYLNNFLNNMSYVGFLTTFFMIVSLISYVFLIPIVQKNSKTFLYLFALVVYFLSYLFFSFFNNLFIVIFIGIVLSVVCSLRINVFGIIVADKSKKGRLSENEGIIYTLTNLAWLIGPLIAGFIAQMYRLNLVFLFASFFILLAIVSLKSFNVVDDRARKKPKTNFIILFKEFFSDKSRTINYLLSGGVTFWWAFVYTYLPLYIVNRGFGEEYVGILFFIVAIPLVIFETPFSKIASKIGFKKAFFIGYIIMGIGGILCYFFLNIYVLFFLFFIISIGCAMLEPTTEAYFMDTNSKKEIDEFYGIYNTTIDVFYSLSAFFAALILLFFDFKFLFIFYGSILFLFGLITLFLKDFVEYPEAEK